MKGGKKPFGYTIIEVMIVLAISGVMFLIAMEFISGKQELASFDKGVNDMATEIQNVIEQINDGQYTDLPINCNLSASSSSLSITTPSAGTSTQGTNSPCVFLGKFFQFEPVGTNYYNVFTLAGARVTSTGDPVTDINNAEVTPVAPAGTNHTSPDLTSLNQNPENLTVNRVYYIDPSAPTTENTIYGFGLVQNLGSSVGSASSESQIYASGSNPINIYYAPNLGSTASESTAAGALTSQTATQAPIVPLPPDGGIVICLTDGTRAAELILGTSSATNAAVNNGDLSINIKQLGMASSCP